MRFQHLVFFILLPLTLISCGKKPQDTTHHIDVHTVVPPESGVPLYDDLGDHHYAISSTIPSVQEYFDQGLRLYYAFNHAESVRAFKEAQRLDPDCAICWWGEAMAWGPNINLPMDAPSGEAAYAAVQGAIQRKASANEQEKAMIDALSVRYEAEPPDDRAHLDQAYSDAMADLAKRYPDNPEIAVLYAESLLDLRPWDYWAADGSPNPGIADALSSLNKVIAIDEKHPGACHFYIHAVEKLYPERAIECAERLLGLMPGAGHLVHMPGHIYIRVGRYLDAVELNRHAIHADETYIQDQNPAMGMYTVGYYPHNYDFLAFAAMMIGRSEDSISAAEKVATMLPQELFGTPGMDFLQHWSARPMQMRVRFAKWDELLAADAPPDNLVHAKAIWHYARGRAQAAKGNSAEANEELRQLRDLATGEGLDGIKMEFNESGSLLAVAVAVLEGRISASLGSYDEAVKSLENAVRLEDDLLYGEPPEWSIPTRQDLGAVLLAAGRYSEAEQIFREDLDKFPKNGWSLHGLAEALDKQGRDTDAVVVKAEFDLAWATADVEP
ncbi:MAG: tetratricopeptide (TPR) repeat protein [Lysobacterales bacterium]|jgi:tetratricopeptide (TPR) repeat protein